MYYYYSLFSRPLDRRVKEHAAERKSFSLVKINELFKKEMVMKRPKSLTKKLKLCDNEINLYARALEKENLRLHERIVKLEEEVQSEINKRPSFWTSWWK